MTTLHEQRREPRVTDYIKDLLASFKQTERPEVVLAVVDDMAAAKVLLAWTHTLVRTRRPISRCRSTDPESQWRWLWRHTRYSLRDLAARSGQSIPDLRRLMATLSGNRVLYPDGTLNQYAQRYLRKKVVEVFDTKASRGRRQPATSCVPPV
jgi:hypothetical protein